MYNKISVTPLTSIITLLTKTTYELKLKIREAMQWHALVSQTETKDLIILF
jgi:hypothetical protein